jgi:lipoprotein-anchoring transpeptidase ErfK/SrfK
VRDQRLDLRAGERLLASYPVSTSRFGLGFEEGSKKTPSGRFRISEKIGAGSPPGTVFRGRVPLAPNDPLPETEDLILSRILWLDEDDIGRPGSHGCVRMKSADLIALFEQIPLGAEVVIEA